MQTATVDQTAGSRALAASQFGAAVEHELQAAQFIDIHTHLYMPSLGPVGLWGIDNLVTYHYLEAELFRSSSVQPAAYWQLSQREKADAIWKALFVRSEEHTSELQSLRHLVCRLLLEKKKTQT